MEGIVFGENNNYLIRISRDSEKTVNRSNNSLWNRMLETIDKTDFTNLLEDYFGE